MSETEDLENFLIESTKAFKNIGDSIDFIQQQPGEFTFNQLYKNEDLENFSEDLFLRKNIKQLISKSLEETNLFLDIFLKNRENQEIELISKIKKYKNLFLECFTKTHSIFNSIKQEIYGNFLNQEEEEESKKYKNPLVEIISNFSGITSKFIEYDINNLINDLALLIKCPDSENIDENYWTVGECPKCKFKLSENLDLTNIDNRILPIYKESIYSLCSKPKADLAAKKKLLKDIIIQEIGQSLKLRVLQILKKFGFNNEISEFNECSILILEYLLKKIRESEKLEEIHPDFKKFFDISQLNKKNILEFTNKLKKIQNSEIFKRNIIKSLQLICIISSLDFSDIDKIKNAINGNIEKKGKKLINTKNDYNNINSLFDIEFKSFLKKILETSLTELEKIKDNYDLCQVNDLIKINVKDIKNEKEKNFIIKILTSILNRFNDNLIITKENEKKLPEIEKELFQKGIKVELIELFEEEFNNPKIESQLLRKFIKFKKKKLKRYVNYLLNKIPTAYSQNRESLERELKEGFFSEGYLFDKHFNLLMEFYYDMEIYKRKIITGKND